MTDQELEQRLRSWYREQISDAVRAPAVLRTSVAAIPVEHRRRLGWPWGAPTSRLSFRIATAAVIGVLALGGGLYLFQRGQPEVGGASPTPRGTASPGVLRSSPRPSPETATSPPGPIGTGRQIHTATMLGDGRVLVAGGYALGDFPVASAVIYDPATNTFRATGSLAEARGYHTATLLSDGRVLVAGGGPASWPNALTGITGPFLASAELYKPRTGTFSPTGSMTTPREVHTATLLADGRVLITGGADYQSRAVASAEVYDPKTGRFSPTGSMTIARAFHTATLLADGRVLITGGSPAAWGTTDKLASAEIYDPKTGKFSATGSMTEPREFHTATMLADGRVLVAGGSGSSVDDLASVEIYDPSTGRFTATGSLHDGRTYHTATLLADGHVLIAGGGSDYTNLKFLASAELYDPATGTFSLTGPLGEARSYHAATLLADGRVLVTGGYGAVAPLASAEIYDPRTGTFSPVV
jgi:hypothetical protein